MRTTRLVMLFVLATATTAAAHVTVWPRESRPGASEKYLVRVPTEGKVATTEVELEVPANVTIAMLVSPRVS